jgi:clan AA aspartic protease
MGENMIQGKVNAELEPVVRLTIRGANGKIKKVMAVVDTGFNGSLTLPPAVIRKLDLKWRMDGSAELANGNIERFDIHAGAVIWNGRIRKIFVEAADTTPLVGMRLLFGFELRIQSIIGGNVSIEPLP